MSNNKELEELKKEFHEAMFKQSEVTTDLLLRMVSIENLLLTKNIVSKEEMNGAFKDVSEKLTVLIQKGLENLKKEAEDVKKNLEDSNGENK